MKISNKKYYRIEMELLSPLSVGNGVSDQTDKDVLLDTKGRPYILGSAIAGVLRAELERSTASHFFGNVNGDEQEESKVITYDANVCEDYTSSVYISKRDMVALDSYKVAIPGAKFDFQIIEPGIKMLTYLEVNNSGAEADCHVLDTVLSGWQQTGLHFGGKTRRGYGLTKAVKIETIEFEFPDRKEKWLDFDMYDTGAAWNEWTAFSPQHSKGLYVSLKLKQHGGISIREYSTKINEPDYKQMTFHNPRAANTAVIPGTSWAGAFRSHMRKLGMNDGILTEIFGKVRGKTSEGHISRIAFSESVIADGVDIVYTRNAIDRFTGGTKDGALYKESSRYNGETELAIEYNASKEVSTDEFAAYLAASIMDIDNGYLAVGGLTAIGRGLFEVVAVEINQDSVSVNYSSIRNRIKEVLGHE